MPNHQTIMNPAGYITLGAIAHTSDDGTAEPVSLSKPLPSQPSFGRAASSAVSDTLSTNGNSQAFMPDLARPIWVRLSGTWAGTAQLKRSTDGGNSWFAITSSSGMVKGVWSGNVNAPITEETCVGAIYRLEATLASGTVNYEVRQ